MWFCQSQQGRKQGSKNLSKIHLCGWLRKAIYSQSSWNISLFVIFLLARHLNVGNGGKVYRFPLLKQNPKKFWKLTLFYVVYIPFLRSILRISVRILLAHLLFSAALLKAAPETRTFSKGGVPSLSFYKYYTWILLVLPIFKGFKKGTIKKWQEKGAPVRNAFSLYL